MATSSIIGVLVGVGICLLGFWGIMTLCRWGKEANAEAERFLNCTEVECLDEQGSPFTATRSTTDICNPSLTFHVGDKTNETNDTKGIK